MAVLVATDFSSESVEAARVAGDLARVLNTELRLIHVVTPDGPLTEAAARQHLASALEGLNVAGLRVETALVRGPLLAPRLAMVQASAPELVVIGGRRATGKDSFRGHADALVRAIHVPVLVARPETAGLRHALEVTEPLRVFVAIDRPAAADAAIVWLEKLRARIACEIVVGHYFWPPDEYARLGLDAAGQPFVATSALVETLERETHERFSGLAATCEVTVYCEPRIGQVAINVLSTARAYCAHLAVVGPHQRRGLDRAEHGVVSRDVLDHCDMPVVCVGNE